MTRIVANQEQVYFPRSGAIYRGIKAADVGNGLFVIRQQVRDLVIEDVEVEGAYRVIENAAARGEGADCVGLRVANAKASGLRRGFARIRYASRDGRMSDISAQGLLTTGASDLPVGIAFDGDARNFLLERCTMRGFRWKRDAGQYWNGDGYSTERGNRGFVFRQCAAWENSDGGFDIKSSETVLDDCVSGHNARNYRLWSDLRATRVTSIEPTKLGGIGDTNHFSLMGPKASGAEPLTIQIEHLIVRSQKGWPVFDVHDGPVRIIINSHDIDVPPGTPLIRTRGKGSVPGGIRFSSHPPKL